MPPWVTGFLLKRLLPALLILSALGYAVTRIEGVGYRRGYDSRWAETLPGEIRADYARAKLADDQHWRVVIADFTMFVSSVIRENAYARNLAAAAAITDGLSGRVWDAENRLQGCAVPGASAGDGDAQRGSGSPERLAELHRREQAVYDAAGRCGAQESALESRPVCECATSSGPR